MDLLQDNCREESARDAIKLRRFYLTVSLVFAIGYFRLSLILGWNNVLKARRSVAGDHLATSIQ